MGKYIIKRILLMLLTIFVIMTMCLVFVRLLPLPPVTHAPGVDVELQYKSFVRDGYLVEISADDLDYEPTTELVYTSNKDGTRYYKAPIVEALVVFWKNIFTRWDWGNGVILYKSEGSIWNVLLQKLPYTILVNLYSIIVAIPLGLAFGIYAALRKNKWQDHVISTGVMIFVSVPSYVYAFLVQYIFCFKLRWFPLVIPSLSQTGFFSWNMFVAMMPAILSLSLGVIAGFTRYTRAELSEVLTCEFMLLARTKGLTKGQATVRHALRNAMVVIFPMILGEFIGILGGSLIIENIFSIPGVGSLYIQSINALDYNYFMGLNFFYTAIGLASGIIVDISYGIIDPRIRMGER